MIGALKNWTDQFLGRGGASITVPVLDGALKSNQMLEDAEVFAQLKAPEDLATDGDSVFVADGMRVLRYDALADGGAAAEAARFDRPVTALACLAGGGLAVALDGREVRIAGGPHDGRRWEGADGRAFLSVNAIGAASAGRILITEGSRTQPQERWKHDLMERGHSGRAIELTLASGAVREIAGGLAYAFGACLAGSGPDAEIWVCESWRHRVVQCGGARSGRAVLDGLPGYPSRIAPSPGGGYWLTAFTLRTQLVEFVLREPAFRKRMMREIEPEYWVSPALNSGNHVLEPLQAAQLRTMGVVKPWAPPRSYGLVIRLSPEGLVRYSLHSRFDGKHHGVVAAVECRGRLFVLAKGCQRVLRLTVADAERSLQA
jgi:hypothetical protein